MRSEGLDAVPRSFRIATEDHVDLRANQLVPPDTRRFAAIFPLEVPEAVSVDCGNTTDEEHDSSSRWEFASAVDEDAPTTQLGSVANVDEGSTLSAAEQVIARYRAIHDSDHAPECSRTEIKKEPSHVPDDQRSVYTLATSTDVQSTMDMMWRPKPKIRMHRTYRRELIQAQSQAIAMMHNAGLKPTNKIQCRRQGCADILSNVEALKYHIHIHNIADMTARHNDASCTSLNPTGVECSTWSSKTSKKNDFRSRPSVETEKTVGSPPRKLSAGGLFPGLFSSRENTPEAERVPSLTTVAKVLISDPSPSNSAGPLRMRNNSEATSTQSSTAPRGRRKKKRAIAVSSSPECNPTIAMLLSPPSSPDMRGRLVLTPRTNSSSQLALHPTMNDEHDGWVSVPNENAQSVYKKLMGSRSPVRALSPTRAMSPIRNGFRRIFSIGCSVDFTEK